MAKVIANLDQDITIVGHEFDWDFYSKNQAAFHALRFDFRGSHVLTIVGYHHKYSKDATIVVGVALGTPKHGDIDPEWTPQLITVDCIIEAQDAIAGPIQALAPLFEEEYGESLNEVEVSVYRGLCRCLVTAFPRHADRADLVV